VERGNKHWYGYSELLLHTLMICPVGILTSSNGFYLPVIADNCKQLEEVILLEIELY
jgi:hypothetical protein